MLIWIITISAILIAFAHVGLKASYLFPTDDKTTEKLIVPTVNQNKSRVQILPRKWDWREPNHKSVFEGFLTKYFPRTLHITLDDGRQFRTKFSWRQYLSCREFPSGKLASRKDKELVRAKILDFQKEYFNLIDNEIMFKIKQKEFKEEMKFKNKFLKEL